MSKPKIAVVIGSTRANRFGDKPADWIAKHSKGARRSRHRNRRPARLSAAVLRRGRLVAWAPSQNEVAQRWQKKVAEFDGFIFTAAEYNHGPTAVLKNALDYADKRMEQEAGGLRRLRRRRRRARRRAACA